MLASRDLDLVQLRAAGENIVTRVYVFEGEVDVTSLIDGTTQSLRVNEILEADMRGLGAITIDPERTRAFLQSVTTGLESSPEPDRRMLDRDRQRMEIERRERIDDATQKEMIRPEPHPEPIPPKGGLYPP